MTLSSISCAPQTSFDYYFRSLIVVALAMCITFFLFGAGLPLGINAAWYCAQGISTSSPIWPDSFPSFPFFLPHPGLSTGPAGAMGQPR
ncbi:hypothetical protein Micbo1qcDRAFT_164770, partial [Microdochium bolleyi]